MAIFPDEDLGPAEQFLCIAKAHFKSCALERIRAQPWFQPAVPVRDHIENDAGEMDELAWLLDCLDPCACPRDLLLQMIEKAEGERRAWLEGIYTVRERMHQTGQAPFN